MVYLHLTLAHSKGQNQDYPNFDCKYLVNDDKYCNCNTYRKSPIGFPLVYLHLTLTHYKCQGFQMMYLYLTFALSKGHSQGHAIFDSEYLVNNDR